MGAESVPSCSDGHCSYSYFHVQYSLLHVGAPLLVLGAGGLERSSFTLLLSGLT